MSSQVVCGPGWVEDDVFLADAAPQPISGLNAIDATQMLNIGT